MMRELDLREYEKSGPLALSAAERDALREALPSVTIEPAPGAEGSYVLTPSAVVGALEVDDLSVLVRPKIGIPQLLSLACYAQSKFKPRGELFDFRREDALPDVLARALSAAARRAFSRGLLHGYRTEEEALYTVRGRIRFAEQIRRRFGVPLPVEVRYDEFTDDILENRLVRAATTRLGAMTLRSGEARRGLGWTAGMLDNVSPEEFPPNAVPEIEFDRLNEHYRTVVALSRLVLRHTAFESGRGEVRASGFLMDMNDVFQEFVTVALREALGVSESAFCSDRDLTGNRRIYLDKSSRRQARTRPDLVGRRRLRIRGRREVQERHRRVGPERRPVPAPGVRHGARPAGRAAGLREGRGGHGGASRPPFRQAAGGSRRSTCLTHSMTCSTACAVWPSRSPRCATRRSRCGARRERGTQPGARPSIRADEASALLGVNGLRPMGTSRPIALSDPTFRGGVFTGAPCGTTAA